MSTSQIPLHFDIFGRDGKMTQPWAFWFSNFQNNLPPAGTGFVVDGSATTYGTMTIYQGPDAHKSGTPGLGDIYVAIDTGKIYVSYGGTWVTQLPAYTGDATVPIHDTVITLNTVNSAPGTWGDASNYPVITVNEKGLVTNVTLEPSSGGDSGPAGSSNEVQFNLGGSFAAVPQFTYNNATNTLQVFNENIIGQITFNNPIPTRTNLLPVQTGNAGEVLATDGTDVYWESTGQFEMLFNYGDATPKNLMIIPANKIIESVSIVLMTAFDDPATSLSIGDAGNVNRLLSTTDNTTLVAGTYTTEPAYKYAVNTQITLSITPGATTQGNGLITITYQK